MKRQSDFDQLIEDYFLGELPPAKLMRLEEQLLTDHELPDRVEAFEEYLIESYWRGTLPKNKYRKFKRYYLGRPELKEKFESHREIMEVMYGNRVIPSWDRDLVSSLWRKILDVILPIRWPPIWEVGVGVAGILLVASNVWLFLDNRQLRKEREEYQNTISKLNQPRPLEVVQVAIHSLKPDAKLLKFMGSKPAPRKCQNLDPVIPPSRGMVELRLSLPPNFRGNDSATYRVSLRLSNEDPVWEGPGIRKSVAGEIRVVVTVPRDSFPKQGVYNLRLTEETASGNREGKYCFKAEMPEQ